jgi:poly(A) polymerase
MWEKFDEGTMGIVVRHIKRSVFFHWYQAITSLYFSSGLPDSVFDPGERKLAQKRTKVRQKRREDMTFLPLINEGTR